jgi:hypothetical protein
MMADIVEIGHDLLAAKEHLAHRQFLNWVEAEAGIMPRTAQNYMRLARLCDKNENFSFLPPSTVYALAVAPASVIEAVSATVEQGEIVRGSAVKDMIADAKDASREVKHAEAKAQKHARRPKWKREQIEREQREREEERRRRQEDITKAAEALFVLLSPDTGRCAHTILNDSYDAHAVIQAWGERLDGATGVGDTP